ncbi:flavin prenyltransferase UbiX [Rheinheimera baltica]|uniref:Flavin prenyltransferase UbiX n=1 Tax=Rheinheimera baltica TaxID=67576 RepID=A0ABT9HXY5_9GAMM|nr:flavin prenyltransferase UbiX [Rheinheimera baltica]MDP5135981.1 UbiX family flavin prenyltransferase [Rheinheimera baltica]MDP5144373.1 UbiX family flavin prenyltransferase [Rheinheimera baltica]MDP5151817.1 UbiX family flavin prenyltransferase [Rheinheimera baltica]MDP5190819.1 UbiX family flavin prenyltransferase [Rheinheimera baltica]
MTTSHEITLAFSGASGAPYGWRLLELLLAQGIKVHLLVSSAARVVFATEHDIKLPAAPEKCTQMLLAHFGCDVGLLKVYGKDDWFSPVASGSAAPKQMVICPCSTGTVSSIAVGASDNLIERAADVVIKEGGQLILVPRESPLSAIHLENLLKLAKLGVTIMPAAPGFYHQPKQISDLVDFMVARILDHLKVPHQLLSRWGYSGNTTQTGEQH